MYYFLNVIFNRVRKWVHSRDYSAPRANNNSTSTFFTPKDEIVGQWENDLDDGSGLHAIWGYAYVFNEDGTAKSYMWEQGKINNEHTYTFSWKRLGPNTIEVKLDEEDEGEVLEYNITTVNAPYSGKLYKLTDSSYVPDQYNSEGFWNGFGPVFKYKSPLF